MHFFEDSMADLLKMKDVRSFFSAPRKTFQNIENAHKMQNINNLPIY
jgi:hypothetical protein